MPKNCAQFVLIVLQGPEICAAPRAHYFENIFGWAREISASQSECANSGDAKKLYSIRANCAPESPNLSLLPTLIIFNIK